MNNQNEQYSKEDYKFYFPVCVWFDGNEPRFEIDNDVVLSDGFIFNEKEDKWDSAIHGPLSDWDHEAFLHLMDKLSNVKYTTEGE
jgi:hypothetical protein